MNILLIHEQTEVREMVRFGIESQYSIKIFEAMNVEAGITLLDQFKANRSALEILRKVNSQNDAVKALEGKTNFDFIICSEQARVVKLVEYIQQNNLKTNLVLWGSPKGELKGLEDKFFQIIHGKDIAPDICKILESQNITNRFQESASGANIPLDQIYCPIKTPLLIRVSPLKSDVFIRLSAKKYVKLFPEGATFDLEDLKKYYKEKKVEYLYLHRDECQEFISKFRVELEELIATDKIDMQAADETIKDAHETMMELLNRTGFTEDVQEIARQSVKLTLKVMGESPELIAILNRLKEGREKYITSHSMLCAHVSCAISALMAWNSTNTYEKLAMASFMHDVTLRNHSLAAIDTLEELETRKGEFTEEEVRAYKNHPIEASLMLRKMSKVPADVDAIIAQHHEKADGGGFPRGITHTHIGHLSCLFIVAHDMTKFILDRGDTYSLEDFIHLRQGEYTKGNFRKVFDVLVKSNGKQNH